MTSFSTIRSWDDQYDVPVFGAAIRAATAVRTGERYAQFPVSRRLSLESYGEKLNAAHPSLAVYAISLSACPDDQGQREARFASRQDQDLYILFAYNVGEDAVKVAFPKADRS